MSEYSTEGEEEDNGSLVSFEDGTVLIGAIKTKAKSSGKGFINPDMVYPRLRSNSSFAFSMPSGVYKNDNSDLKRGPNQVLLAKTKIAQQNVSMIDSKGWIILRTPLRIEALMADDCHALPYAMSVSNLTTDEITEMIFVLKGAKSLRFLSEIPYLTSFKLEKNFSSRVYGFKAELTMEGMDPIDVDIVAFYTIKMLSIVKACESVQITDVVFDMHLSPFY